MHSGFLAGVGALASVTLPVCLLMSGSSVPLVNFAYGSEWANAAPVLVWLAGVGALRILFELSYDYFVVLARSRVVFTVQLAWLVALVPALIVGTRVDGVRGAGIAGLAVAGGVVLPWYLIELHGAGIRLRSIIGRVWMPLLGGAAVGVIALDFSGLLTNNLMVLLVSGVIALVMMGLLIYHQLPGLIMLKSVFANADSTAGESERAVAGAAAGGTAATEKSPNWMAPDITMPLPSLHERLLYRMVQDEAVNAGDMTIPLPIFRDTMEFRLLAPEVSPVDPHEGPEQRSRPRLPADHASPWWVAAREMAPANRTESRSRRRETSIGYENPSTLSGPSGRGNDD